MAALAKHREAQLFFQLAFAVARKWRFFQNIREGCAGAVFGNPGQISELLLRAEAGSDLNAADPLGWTAAHYAAEYGHAAALKFLHEAPL